MKKIFYFIIILIIILVIIFGIYINYKMNYNLAQKENRDFEYYFQKEIYGSNLTTIINKVIDINENNQVEIDENDFYISDKKNSIIIEIYISDNEKIYRMETIYKGGMNNFIENYGNIKFKCTKKEYHKETNKISYLYFEQISD